MVFMLRSACVCQDRLMVMGCGIDKSDKALIVVGYSEVVC